MTKFKKGLCIALAVILGIVALGSVSTFAKNDTRSIVLNFDIGSIDPQTGEYVEDNTSIYTKNVFECGGLRIEPDFKFKGTYDVFYYSADGFVVGSAKGLTGVYKMNETQYVGQYARVVIHPEVPSDYEGKEPWEIMWYEVVEYSSQIDIRVGKDGFKYRDFVNLYNDADEVLDMTYISGDTASYTPVLDYNSKLSGLIDLDEDYKTLEVVCKFKFPPKQGIGIVFVGENGESVSTTLNDLTQHESGIYHLTIEIPADATGVALSIPKDANVFVYGITK